MTAPPVSSPHTLGQQYFGEETSLNCYKGSGCYPSDVCGAYLTTSSSALRIIHRAQGYRVPCRGRHPPDHHLQRQHRRDRDAERHLHLRQPFPGRHRLYQFPGEPQHAHPPAGPGHEALVPVPGRSPSCLPAAPGAPSASSGASITSAMRSPRDRSSFCSPRGIGRGGRGNRDFSRAR